MKKEDIGAIAQLLNGMRDSAEKLEIAIKERDLEETAKAKKELLDFQKRVSSLI
jgi:hypothetical protein